MKITAPSLKRRLASMLYEAMLLFAIVFVSNWIFAVLAEQRHALYLRHAAQGVLFVAIGLYFVWFWRHGGQTLAMKTWRLKLVKKDGNTVDLKHAIIRYLAGWMWVLPGLAFAWAIGAKGSMLLFIPLANVVLWILTIYLDSERQFLHDRVAGTRIINVDSSSK